MKVDIIIPNFNGAHLLEKNLPAVFGSLEEYGGKVIVVDDGSEIQDLNRLKVTVNKFQKEGYKIELHIHKKNKGFSSAVNTGVKQSEAEFVVLLNSDVVPTHDFLRSPIDKLTRDSALFGVGCMDESIEDGKTVLRGRGLARWNKGFLQHSKGDVNHQDSTFWISGGSSVIRRELYALLGGMDEIYNPFYWEDIDLSYRAQKSGFKIVFDRNSIVKHYHEEGAIKKHFGQKEITTTSYRNQFIFVWKNITDSKLIASHLLHLPAHIFSAIKGWDTNLLKGLFLAVVKLPAIIDRRNKQKKLYKISDAEIINSIP